jgi:hypothetical protein
VPERTGARLPALALRLSRELLAFLQGGLHPLDDFLDVDQGLGQVTVGTQFDGFNDGLLGAVGGDYNELAK